MSNVKVVTAAELISHGINPDCVICSRRIKGEPLDVRYKDHRIQRLNSGALSISFGYYSEAQIKARKIAGKRFCEAIEKSPKLQALFKIIRNDQVLSTS